MLWGPPAMSSLVPDACQHGVLVARHASLAQLRSHKVQLRH